MKTVLIEFETNESKIAFLNWVERTELKDFINSKENNDSSEKIVDATLTRETGEIRLTTF